MVKITSVTPHSRAERHGISAGDILVSINGREVTDVLDYRFFLTATEVKLSLTRGNEPFEAYETVIRKREYDDIGRTAPHGFRGKTAHRGMIGRTIAFFYGHLYGADSHHPPPYVLA